MNKKNIIKKAVENLMDNGLVGFKAGTEAEKQTPTEILAFACHIPDNHEIRIKIGGPEDNATMKALYACGFKNYIAPMVESPFAVKKFVMAADWVTGGHKENLMLTVNLESITAFEKCDEILTCKEMAYLHKVNIGKTDLALSINRSADDEEVLKMAAQIVSRAKAKGKITGIGGSINIRTIDRIIDIVHPDEFETRNVIFATNKIKDAKTSVRCALEFEEIMLEIERRTNQFGVDDSIERIRSLTKRLQVELKLAA